MRPDGDAGGAGGAGGRCGTMALRMLDSSVPTTNALRHSIISSYFFSEDFSFFFPSFFLFSSHFFVHAFPIYSEPWN